DEYTWHDRIAREMSLQVRIFFEADVLESDDAFARLQRDHTLHQQKRRTVRDERLDLQRIQRDGRRRLWAGGVGHAGAQHTRRKHVRPSPRARARRAALARRLRVVPARPPLRRTRRDDGGAMHPGWTDRPARPCSRADSTRPRRPAATHAAGATAWLAWVVRPRR